MLAGIDRRAVRSHPDHGRSDIDHDHIDHGDIDHGLFVNDHSGIVNHYDVRFDYVHDKFNARVVPHASDRGASEHGNDLISDHVDLKFIFDIYAHHIVDTDLGGLRGDYYVPLKWRLRNLAGIGYPDIDDLVERRTQPSLEFDRKHRQ